MTQLTVGTSIGAGFGLVGAAMSGRAVPMWNSPNELNRLPIRLVIPTPNTTSLHLAGSVADSTGGYLIHNLGGKLDLPNGSVIDIPVTASMKVDDALRWQQASAENIPLLLNKNTSAWEQAYLTSQLQNDLIMVARNAMDDVNAATWLSLSKPTSGFREWAEKFADQYSGSALFTKVREAAIAGMKNIGCFAAGTLVHTQQGLRPIETINVGDYVLSKPEGGEGEMSYKRVTKTFEYQDKEVIFLQIRVKKNQERVSGSGEYDKLLVTRNHPFWVLDQYLDDLIIYGDDETPFLKSFNTWVRADLLRPGMTLLLQDGRTGVVSGCDRLNRMAIPGYGWWYDIYSDRYDDSTLDGFDEYYNYGEIITLDDNGNIRYGGGTIKAGDQEIIPCDPNADPNSPAPGSSLYLNEGVNWRAGYTNKRGVDWENEDPDLWFSTTVYNLEVEDDHTYFVGDMGVWVHNTNCEELSKFATGIKIFSSIKDSYTPYVNSHPNTVEINIVKDYDKLFTQRWASIQQRTLGSIHNDNWLPNARQTSGLVYRG